MDLRLDHKIQLAFFTSLFAALVLGLVYELFRSGFPEGSRSTAVLLITGPLFLLMLSWCIALWVTYSRAIVLSDQEVIVGQTTTPWSQITWIEEVADVAILHRSSGKALVIPLRYLRNLEEVSSILRDRKSRLILPGSAEQRMPAAREIIAVTALIQLGLLSFFVLEILSSASPRPWGEMLFALILVLGIGAFQVYAATYRMKLVQDEIQCFSVYKAYSAPLNSVQTMTLMREDSGSYPYEGAKLKLADGKTLLISGVSSGYSALRDNLLAKLPPDKVRDLRSRRIL
ncbi:MAG TPA: hypothetical protein VEX38_04365 [Fimbriimonadaceae bacterium]|nr:hypothetical protein [Fimbriimonadaceae bacterium]